jgi:hypothetical protein
MVEVLVTNQSSLDETDILVLPKPMENAQEMLTSIMVPKQF